MLPFMALFTYILGSFGLVNAYIQHLGLWRFSSLNWGSSTQGIQPKFPGEPQTLGVPQTYLSNEKRAPGCLGCIGDSKVV